MPTFTECASTPSNEHFASRITVRIQTAALAAMLGLSGCSSSAIGPSSPGSGGQASSPIDGQTATGTDATGGALAAQEGASGGVTVIVGGTTSFSGNSSSSTGPAGNTFVHPGLLHTQADFERMAAKVAAKASPWIDSWNLLIANSHASLTWNPNPQTEIHRNDGTNPDNHMTFANDVAAAYASALRWKVSGDTQYADKAVQVLNAGSGAQYYVVRAVTPNGETTTSNEARAFATTQPHTYFSFDAGSGTSANDDSGNTHTGTLLGNATWAAGKTGNAVLLDGTSGYISLPNDLMNDVADFTVAAWVYWNGASNNQRIFDFGTGIGEYLYLTPRDGSGHLRFGITTNLGAGEEANSIRD